MVACWNVLLLLLILYLHFQVFQADFTQCTTIWEARKIHNNTIEDSALRENGGLGETTYTMIHLLSAFWVPLFIIAISYTLICVRYLNHVLAMAGNLNRPLPATETLRLTSARFTEISQAVAAWSKRCPRASPDAITDTYPSYGSARRPGLRLKSPGITPDDSQTQQQQPSAVVQCRTRVFRTSGLVVLCYVCCWAPYNILALWKVVDPSSFYPLSEQLNILNALIVLNSVFNPLIYGFR